MHPSAEFETIEINVLEKNYSTFNTVIDLTSCTVADIKKILRFMLSPQWIY